jgi:hypothetical protein
MDSTGWTALVAGGVAVALIGAVIAAVTLRRATDVTVGGRPTLLFRVAYSELAALTDGRAGARRTAAFALAAVVGGLLLTAVLGLLARPLAGLVDDPLTERLVAWHDAGAADVTDALILLGDRAVVVGFVLVAGGVLAIVWPRLSLLPGALLAAAAAAAWAGTELVAAAVPGTWPAFPPAVFVAVYGGALLLLQIGLRMLRRRGLPIALGVVAWLAFAVLAWAVAFAEAFRLSLVPTAAGGGAVLGAFLLLAVAIVAVRHSGLAAARSSGRVQVGKPLSAPRRTG